VLSHGPCVARTDQSLRGQCGLTWMGKMHDFPRYCPISTCGARVHEMFGVHRYKLVLLVMFTITTPHSYEVPNLPVAVDARGRSACYPRGSFYPLSPDPSTRGPRIT
jgi:hypothetical protein